MSSRAVAVDAAAVAAVSVAICAAADELAFMTLFVPAVIAVRFALWPGRLAPELALFALCVAIGGVNDWLSVMVFDVYDYTVPHYFAASDIPVWMLLFWGMALRFLATLFAWPGLGERPPPPGARRLAVGLALVVVTRQLVYRLYDQPVLSWLPFALALAVFVAAARPRPRDLRAAAIVAVGGPAVEVLYIQLGGLHRYELGWIGGVPLWIALWWALAALVWNDVTARIAR